MKRKTKIAILATSLLVSIALIGVGFASWVILSQTTDEVTGNVKAQAVNNASLDKFEAKIDNNDNFDIVFGAPSPSESGWLTNDEAGSEALEFNITLAIKGQLGGLALKVDISNNSNFEQAVNAGYITGPEFSITSGQEKITLNTGNTFSVTDGDFSTESNVVINVKFGWGAAFDGKNPYTFFNEKGYGTLMSEYDVTGDLKYTDATYAEGKFTTASTKKNNEYANEVLNDLYSKLGGVSPNVVFTFTFTATAAQAE